MVKGWRLFAGVAGPCILGPCVAGPCLLGPCGLGGAVVEQIANADGEPVSRRATAGPFVFQGPTER